MAIRVNPTRMELSRLKKRLKTAVRGHKLLKDKQDEMARQFMAHIRRNRELREQVECLRTWHSGIHQWYGGLDVVNGGLRGETAVLPAQHPLAAD